MTARHRRGLMAPRRPRTINTYGIFTLDNTREEYALERWQVQRQAAADDPWLAPMKSEAVRALLILIQAAETSVPAVTPPAELDLERIYADAGVTGRQLEVLLMFGEGWGVGAIAKWLGLAHQTVSQHLAYGRRKLIRMVLPPDLLSARRN